MTKTLLALIVVCTTSLIANAVTVKEKDLIVTSVTVTTPLPTGLEGAAAGPDEVNNLYAAVRKDSRVAPFITAAEKKYVSKVEDAAKYGNHASVEVDCNQHPASFGTEDKSFCAITVRKSYGWYADLALILTVEGYLKKSIAQDFE